MTIPLWQPSAERVATANLTAFLAQINAECTVPLRNYAELHRWSVEKPEAFWSAVWSFCGVCAEQRGETVLRHSERMPGAEWFPEARLNFAENLLHRRDASPALVFRNEAGIRRTVSHAELRREVSRIQQALLAEGVKAGDRVAGFLPNLPEAVAAALAAASLGAIWSSCSPDFGVRGVLDRFGQIEARVLLGVNGYPYGGKQHATLSRLREIAGQIPSLRRVVLIPYVGEEPPLENFPKAAWYADWLAPHAPREPTFTQLPFNHPLYILYSSGTTGVPKCIVHGAGGTLLQHLKEHQLQSDIKPGDHFFYFTTCGWMMWNWLVSGLASGASLILYDGSPFHPDGESLFRIAEAEEIHVFGTSAKFIDAVHKAGLTPGKNCNLRTVRTILSTGSPLAPESFDFVYDQIKQDVCLASIAGGTDIISCFVGGNPSGPVWRGECQAPGLGMSVAVYSDDGRPIVGEKGELVCTRPFPSMPLGFWNDPDEHRYRAAYFERFPGVWHHGDYVELTEHGGMIIYGRSDAVLNPGGVRIGTAEIYRPVEQLDEVMESLAIGQEWENDQRLVLFVRLRNGLELDDELRERIRRQIRGSATPRHVPARIVQVPDIPRTKSGKIVELAVREAVHGRPVKNLEALANPEALEHFHNRSELQS